MQRQLSSSLVHTIPFSKFKFMNNASSFVFSQSANKDLSQPRCQIDAFFTHKIAHAFSRGLGTQWHNLVTSLMSNTFSSIEHIFVVSNTLSLYLASFSCIRYLYERPKAHNGGNSAQILKPRMAENRPQS